MKLVMIAQAQLLLLAPVAFLCSAPLARSQQAANVAAPSYRMTQNDVMTMSVQPRHTKLGLGGAARNRGYAEYALGNLKGSLSRFGEAFPVDKDLPLKDMIASIMPAPLAAVETAIKAKDGPAFDSAFSELTGACTACHQAANRNAVVIRIPDASAFPDQEFKSP